MEFGVWGRSRCFFSVMWGGLQKWTGINCLSSVHRVECFFPTPPKKRSPAASKRFPSLGKLHEQTNDKRQESEPAPDCRLEIQARSLGDARPRRRTQRTISPSFSIPPENKVPWPRSEQAPHLGHPPPQSHGGPPSRAAPHAYTTGPVRSGRKPSPAVPVPRHGQKRGPLRCVDQVPRAR